MNVNYLFRKNTCLYENRLLSGRAPAFNAWLVNEELRAHCDNETDAGIDVGDGEHNCECYDCFFVLFFLQLVK